ncbi:MAG TPA: hypothetical protein VLE74_01475 [Candidatus Saccharimonadales bacterium]|nr:hypothetical protein [Candidatus Saccharimonadales bacterium]
MPSDRITKLILEDHKPKPPSSDLSMSGVPAELITEAPPAPPPIQPPSRSHNPYEFITNPGTPVRRKLLPGTTSKTGRFVIAVVGAIVFILLAFIIFGFIRNSGGGFKADYLSLEQQQVELIRVSDIGVAKAHEADAKNLAITTKYSITSQRAAISSLAKKAGASSNPKVLVLGKNSQTDVLLTNADQTNQFDTVFIQTMQTSLKTYQQTLKKIYDGTTKASTKAVLANDFNDVSKLIGSQSTTGGTSANPATN